MSNALSELQRDNSLRCMRRIFLAIARAAKQRHEPGDILALPLILEAEGLARNAAPQPGEQTARRPGEASGPADAAYLSRCWEAIRGVSLELA